MADRELSNWGQAVNRLLVDVNSGQGDLRRRTLLALADAVYAGVSMNSVLSKRVDDGRVTGSAPSHWKWRREDPAYEAAFQFLIGTPATPGVARVAGESVTSEQEAEALASIDGARTRLHLLALPAVERLEAALEATELKLDPHGHEHVHPDFSTQVRAASEILDRGDETTSGSGPVATVKVYLPDNKREAEDAPASEPDPSLLSEDVDAGQPAVSPDNP